MSVNDDERKEAFASHSVLCRCRLCRSGSNGEPAPTVLQLDGRPYVAVEEMLAAWNRATFAIDLELFDEFIADMLLLADGDVEWPHR